MMPFNYIFSNYIISSIDSIDINSIDEKLHVLNSYNFRGLLVKIYYIRSIRRKIASFLEVIEKKDNIYPLLHLQYPSQPQKNKKILRKYIIDIINFMKKQEIKCKLLSIDEEYFNIFSVNELKYFKIIELKRFPTKILRKIYHHDFFVEIYIDDILLNLEEKVDLIPKLKILEKKGKVLISQKIPLIKAEHIPLVYGSIIDDKRIYSKDIVIRLNYLIDDACKDVS